VSRKKLLAALVGVLILVVAIAVPALRVDAQGEADWNPVAGLPLSEPIQLRPHHGVLHVNLDARRRSIVVSGSPIEAQPFNGALIGPTMHVRPGDRIVATIRNATSEDTNIHYHGMHVSPRGISDNVFRVFHPGQTVKSVVDIPADHAPGTYWYHVHLHGLTEEQVMGGMSGLLIVDGLKQLLPPRLRHVRERQLAIRDVQSKGDSIVMDAADIDVQKPSTRLVNGLLEPHFSLRSGETQLWRIANVGADLFYDVQLTGHRMHVIAEDGSPVWRVWSRRHLVLPPGKRYDVLVQGGRPGNYEFRTVKYDEGFELLPTTTLAKVRVGGPAARPDLALPKTLDTPSKSPVGQPVVRKRTFTFSFDFKSAQFARINGQAFNPHAMPVAPMLGTVEQWKLRNVTTEDHPFHIHVNDFQVMRVNGRPYHANGLQDVVIIPKHGSVVIRNPFRRYSGYFVFHCHILAHEDGGMMRTVEVLRKGQKPKPPPGGHMMMMDHGD
jgi:FtsP/CotA-like multicopper oxidase with cupredoxin domain